MIKRIAILFIALGLAAASCACTAEQAINTAADVANSAATSDSPEVQSVKNGHMTEYSTTVTVGEAFDNFLANPMWQYFEAETGEKIVQCNGQCTYNDKTVVAKVQFKLNDDDTFEFGALSFNDIDQNLLTAAAFMEAVFENSQSADAPVPTQAPAQAPQQPQSNSGETDVTQGESSNGLIMFSSDKYPEFSCGYPREMQVYDDGTDSLLTARNPGMGTSIKINAAPSEMSLTNTYKTFVNTHGGSQCIDFSTSGDDYFAVRLNWEDDMEYYAYYKFRNGNMYYIEAEFPSSEFDYGDGIVNAMYNSFSLD